MTADELAARCLAEHRERKIAALVEAMEDIADRAPQKEPRPQKGSDHDVLLAYEDGHADATWLIAGLARDALEDWRSP